MCSVPNQNGPGTSSLPVPPPPLPSVARASNAQPPMVNQAPAGGGALPAIPSTRTAAPTAAPSAPAAAPVGPAGGTPPVAPGDKSAVGGNGLTTPGAPVAGFETTHFGNPDDPDMDKDTRAGKGKWGKLVAGDSLALTDSMAKRLDVAPGDKIELADSKGNKREGTYIDRAPESNDRIDIYDPKGSEKAGTPFNAVTARKLGTRVASAAETLYPKG